MIFKFIEKNLTWPQLIYFKKVSNHWKRMGNAQQTYTNWNALQSNNEYGQ